MDTALALGHVATFLPAAGWQRLLFSPFLDHYLDGRVPSTARTGAKLRALVVFDAKVAVTGV